jgi:FecR protein
MKTLGFVVVSVTVLALSSLVCGLTANAQDYSHVRIVRLSFVEGEVQYQRPGADWQDAKLNLPIQQGFRLQTTNGYAEVEFEQGLAIRLANNSTLEFADLSLLDSHRITKINLSAGTAVVTAHLSRNDELSIAASGMQLAVPRNAEFRVDASPTDGWVTVFRGKIKVESGAQQVSLGSGHTLHENADLSSPEIVQSPARDDFDKWVSQRDQALSGAQSDGGLQSGRYTTGFADLDFFGTWGAVPGFGYGWQPYGAGLNWTPFVAGQWMFMGNTGWNWVSEEPWGWLPYHFGSWLNAPGVGWVWLPQGALSWQPATATWVRTNNQLGWTPTSAALLRPLKPSKSNTEPLRVVILAAVNGPASSIKAAQVMPITQTQAAGAQIVSAPAPGFLAPTVRSMPPATSGANSPPATLQTRGPAALAAPKLSALPASSPRSLSAPRSLPVPARTVSRMSVASRGGFNGGNRSGGAAISRSGVSGASISGAHSASAPSSSGGASSGGAQGGHR